VCVCAMRMRACVCAMRMRACVSLGLTASLLLPFRVNKHICVYYGDTTQSVSLVPAG
jgi:hypothetical protein